MDASLLFPAAFQVLMATISDHVVSLELIFTSSIGYCPHCHAPSRRIHSCYQRRLKDLPMNGKSVELSLCVHKFHCEQPDCPRKIFSQQVDSILKPYARRLERADEQVQALGLVLGSKPGARVCQLMGLPLSASTLLRLIKKTPMPVVQTPAVLGVDDFAFRKGNTYGTILVDLEQRKPIDLLPDREGKTLEDWLKAHPGIKIVARDRSQVYANAITTACPDAIQVADRWHLLKNLSENVVKFLDTQRVIIRQVVQQVAKEQGEKMLQEAKKEVLPVLMEYIGDATPIEENTQPAEVPESVLKKEASGKRHAIYQQVKVLQGHGHGKKAIARHLHISRNTVRKYFQQEVFAPKPRVKRTNLLDFEPYLRLRWQQGDTCVRTLFKEIQAMNYNGSYNIMTVMLADYPKGNDLQTPGLASLPPAVRETHFSSRRLSIALCLPEAKWEKQEKPLLEKMLEKIPMLDQVRLLSLDFRSMINQREGDKLQNWCEKASELAGFKGFVYGIKQDFDAIYQAMTSNWSSGQVEGQVNRLKNIKRQMYGRASFELLRIRVLA